MADFTLYNLFWYFTLYAVIGWCVEVCFCTVDTGKFVNRGFLNGPVCPIYGFGMVIILLLLTPLENNILLLFVGAVLLTSLLELTAGFALKKLFHTSWWDYSDLPFNLGGYICLKFSLLWGLGAVIVMRVLHPLVAGLVHLVPHLVGLILVPIVLALFLCDMAVTVAGIAKLNRDLGKVDDIAKALRSGSNALAKSLGDTALAVDDKLDTAKEKLNSAKADLSDRAVGAKTDLGARVDLARADWTERRSFVSARLMRAFPDMKHMRSNDALQSLKDWYKKK